MTVVHYRSLSIRDQDRKAFPSNWDRLWFVVVPGEIGIFTRKASIPVDASRLRDIQELNHHVRLLVQTSVLGRALACKQSTIRARNTRKCQGSG